VEQTAVGTKYVYDFAEGSKDMRELLGGKGANVAEMTRVLGADRVPAGFTITTEACVAYMAADRSTPDGLDEQVAGALERLEEQAGQKLGDDEDPLLVSVRSGARESMPGMLDTVLNLGLNDRSVKGLAQATDNERFAWDSYRRFVQMFGNVVHGIEGERFEDEIERVKQERGVEEDTELDVDDLRGLVDTFKDLYEFSEDPREQLEQAIRAVFDSWLGERAVRYRRLNRIPDAWGTAVNVQRMVFGNKGDTSGSGVAFSRDEVTGDREPSGDFLPNAQGEDVVSGVRTPRDISELKEWMPEVGEQLSEILRTLERHYKDMQDTEFTVEEGRLYMLQTRSAKRPAQAAVRFAVEAVDEGLLTQEEALLTIDAGGLETLVSERFDPEAKFDVAAMGIPASPGGAKGEIVFTAADAVSAKAEGRDVVLTRPFTDAGDVAGFHAARGILTTTGGKASHAALVARGMGRPAVTGAAKLHIDVRGRKLRLPDGRELGEGDFLAINGSTGEITTDDVPVMAPGVSDELDTVLEWADAARRLGVRANADDEESAARAAELGAEGIGLCRSEHMFLGDRKHLMEDVILAEDDDARRAAIQRLYPVQEDDYARILRAMDGRPVCVRLLDPPLNEFLPDADELPEGSDERKQVEALEEENPMLGTRGVRLGILQPDLYEMQVRALFRAAKQVDGAKVEVMVPLVDYERELEFIGDRIRKVAEEEGGSGYPIGSMIELPRSCFVADRIAEQAEFFSFGTNDLTQTGLGFSREDIEARILERYMEVGILDRSPFETIDEPGVGQLVRMAAWLGRKQRPSLKIGICGEHGGDPESIAFFETSGIDYVSCSPPRVPVARLAAAQAAIRARRATESSDSPRDTDGARESS
jgi:pyruvate, orthophosphate dikinase